MLIIIIRSFKIIGNDVGGGRQISNETGVVGQPGERAAAQVPKDLMRDSVSLPFYLSHKAEENHWQQRPTASRSCLRGAAENYVLNDEGIQHSLKYTKSLSQHNTVTIAN